MNLFLALFLISLQSELPDVRKPFLDDPAKQKRFEQFVREKYEGGLRPKDSSNSSDLSEAARARERLEFEAAAEAMAKGNTVNESKHPNQSPVDFIAASGLQFTTSKVEVYTKHHYTFFSLLMFQFNIRLV